MSGSAPEAVKEGDNSPSEETDTRKRRKNTDFFGKYPLKDKAGAKTSRIFE